MLLDTHVKGMTIYKSQWFFNGFGPTTTPHCCDIKSQSSTKVGTAGGHGAIWLMSWICHGYVLEIVDTIDMPPRFCLNFNLQTKRVNMCKSMQIPWWNLHVREIYLGVPPRYITTFCVRQRKLHCISSLPTGQRGVTSEQVRFPSHGLPAGKPHPQGVDVFGKFPQRLVTSCWALPFRWGSTMWNLQGAPQVMHVACWLQLSGSFLRWLADLLLRPISGPLGFLGLFCGQGVAAVASPLKLGDWEMGDNRSKARVLWRKHET